MDSMQVQPQRGYVFEPRVAAVAATLGYKIIYAFQPPKGLRLEGEPHAPITVSGLYSSRFLYEASAAFLAR